MKAVDAERVWRKSPGASQRAEKKHVGPSQPCRHLLRGTLSNLKESQGPSPVEAAIM